MRLAKSTLESEDTVAPVCGRRALQRRFPAGGHFALLLCCGALLGRLHGAEGIPGAELFTHAMVRKIRIELSAESAAQLRQHPRTNVQATIREGAHVYRDVAIHLKGSTGSFRPLDNKPGLTLNFTKFTPGNSFYGLRKIHLNNSVEDGSYLNERLGAELFRAAGVPAPRVAHAIVELNGRQLGLYVLKEGFTEDFLGLHFRRTNGNLYDTDIGHEAPEDRSDLRQLAAAALEPDLSRRWTQLQKTLDVERFAAFMAMEVLAAHRDGYCMARNNFRLYHDPETDHFVFLPHGMDQLFGPAGLPLRPQMAGLVARQMMEIPEGRQRYREKLATLFSNSFQVAVLARRVDGYAAQLRPMFSRSEAREFDSQIERLKSRIAARCASIARQLNSPDPTPLRFDHGVALLRDWRAFDVPENGRLEMEKAPDGHSALSIHAGPVTAASWRTRALLPLGRYRFAAGVCTRGVQPMPYGRNHGAGLRASGAEATPARRLLSDSPWTTLQTEFQVNAPTAEVELICDLRASAGTAWFDVEALKLIRLE